MLYKSHERFIFYCNRNAAGFFEPNEKILVIHSITNKRLIEATCLLKKVPGERNLTSHIDISQSMRCKSRYDRIIPFLNKNRIYPTGIVHACIVVSVYHTKNIA